MTLCLYAIVSSGTAPVRIGGMRNEPMMIVRAGPISGVVGRLASAPRPSSSNLRAYHQVICQLSDAVPALLPVRFGTTLHSEAEVVTLLEARSGSFRRSLARVRRRVQMTVRFVRKDTRATDAASPAAAVTRSSGTAYLRARAEATRHLATWEPCAALRRLVQRWIKAELIEERNGVVSVYHLIPRAAVARYRRAVNGGGFTAAPQVSGPFPPFAFADAVSEALPALFEGPAADDRSRATPRSGVGHG